MMTPTDPRLDALLARAADGTATPGEMDELRARLDADVEPLGLAGVAPPVDVADAVMGWLEEEAAFAPVAAALREAVARPVDVVDAVLSGIDDLPAIEVMAFADGESPAEARPGLAARLLRDPSARAAIAAQAELGAALRDAVNAHEVDVWPAVAEALGVDPWHVEGWEATADALRAEIAARAPVDVAGAVLARLDPPARRMPAWVSLGVPLGMLAAAAAVLLTVVALAPLGEGAAPFLLASVNDLQVESLETAPEVQAQVLQFDEGGPTIILIDDSREPSPGSTP